MPGNNGKGYGKGGKNGGTVTTLAIGEEDDSYEPVPL